MDPIDFANYFAQQANPMAVAQAGFQQGQQQALLRAQQEQAMAAQQAQDARRAELVQRIQSSPNPSAQDIFNLSMMLPPEQAKSLREGFGAMSADRQQNTLAMGGQVLSAFEAGKPELAAEILQRQSDAAHNSGDEANAKFYSQLAQHAAENQQAAKVAVGTLLAHMPGADKMFEALGKQGSERRAQEMQPGAVAKQQGELVQQGLQAGLTKAQTTEVMARTRNLADEHRRNVMEIAAGGVQAGKPLAPSEMKLVTDNLENMQTASGMQADIDALRGMMAANKLSFGLLSNQANKALNIAGRSTEESRNYATAMKLFNKIRNDYLTLQKGVQTEGDAKRAWEGMFPSLTDDAVVGDGLEQLSLDNARGQKKYQNIIDDVRYNKGLQPLNYDKYKMPASIQSGQGAAQQVPRSHPQDINDLLNKYGR